ncbi:hypothetical protein [Ornithinibacillus sp. 179-J 7C1 HS]|uniref:hypothetical protein n=1 Tax=Ornithinibacillus sp. 179-J 7C1 HS TaxID=3142384 RepID=UPI0039A15CF3
MSKATYSISSILVIFIIVLTVFSFRTEESIIEQAGEKAKEIFYNEEVPEDNYHGEYFSFYLPSNMEVEEVDDFNAILQNGHRTLIVFYNKLESNDSNLNYEAAKTEDAALLESFTDDNKFGYIRLLQDEEHMEYEIQVGVGGVKLTTYTTKNEIISDSENLMKIALSIVQ